MRCGAKAQMMVLLAVPVGLLSSCGTMLPPAVCDAVPDGNEAPFGLCPPPEDDGEEAIPGWILTRPFTPNEGEDEEGKPIEPEVGIRALHDVIALGPTNVYAVGTDGEVIHMGEDGTWTREDVGVDTDLRAISGFTDEVSGDFLVVVGDDGVVLKKDGGEWSAVPNPYIEVLFDVWVADRLDGFIVGDNGSFLRFLGTEVVAMVAESEQIRLAPGNACDPGLPAADNGCPVGTNCQPSDPMDNASPTICWNPNRPDGQIEEAYFVRAPLKGVAGRNANDVIAVGPAGLVMHFDGEFWRCEKSGTSLALSGAHAYGGFWATSQDGKILDRNGGWPGDEFDCAERGIEPNWDSASFVVPSSVFLQDVWMTGTNDMFAVGLAGSIYHRLDGEWVTTELDDDVQLRSIDGVITADATDDTPTERRVWAVGAGGRIVRGPLALPTDFDAVEE